MDCADQRTASRVLRSARSAPVNKRAVAVASLAAARVAAVAIWEPTSFFTNRFRLNGKNQLSRSPGADEARAEAERPNSVETPVTIQINDGAGQLRAVTTDLGEGGMAVQLAHRPKNLGTVVIQFPLPGSDEPIQCSVQVAWENPGRQLGLRFVDLAPEIRERLKTWLESRAPEFDQDDPPAPCKLTDLSLGGCYLETGSPYPLRTRIILSMQVAGARFRAEGVVLVMHPDLGMGVEFTQTTEPQRADLERFIHALTSGSVLPEIMVEPEGLETTEAVVAPILKPGVEDPLLDLFRRRAELTPEAFNPSSASSGYPLPKPHPTKRRYSGRLSLGVPN